MVKNVHDKTYRFLLGDKKEVSHLVNKYVKLHERILPKYIEKYNTRFITEAYEDKEADVIYKIINKKKYILIEHQSSIDYSMIYRIWQYITEIIKEVISNESIKVKSYIPPIVVPIVLYTGKRKWDANIEYTGEENGIKFKYYLIDVNEIDTEELLNSESLLENIMGVEKLKENELFENIMKIVIKERNKGNIEKIRRLLKCVFADIMSKREIETLIKEMRKEKEEKKMLSLGERIVIQMKKEGRAEGRKEGRVEGRLEGKAEEKMQIAKEMLKEKISLEKIVKVTKLKEDEIEKIKAELAST